MTRRTFIGALLPSAFSTRPPDAGCAPGYVVASGIVTADTTGGSFAIGDGLALVPRPETMAVLRMEEFIGAPVEVIVRPIRDRRER